MEPSTSPRHPSSGAPELIRRVAAAESCTGGLLASRIVGIPGSGDWFLGGVVAYDAAVKHRLLDVPRGPVISRDAAMAMERGVRHLIGAEIGAATTGVAGPDPEEDQPPGTVFVAVGEETGTQTVRLQLEGDPDQVRQAATSHALQQVLFALSRPEDSGPEHRVAVPEGGFGLIGSAPLRQISISHGDMSVEVAPGGADPAQVVVVPLPGQPRPEVELEIPERVLQPLGTEGSGLGFEVPVATTVTITWNRRTVSPPGRKG